MEAQLAFLRLQDLHAKMYDECAPEGQKQQKAAALRERQRRQEAQIENSQLKAKIKNCVSNCEVMKSTLQVTNIERAEQTTKESLFAARSLRADLKATQCLSVLNTAIFNILEHHARIREWDSVLYEAQHFTPTTETDTDQVLVNREHGRSESTIELKRTRLIPFSAEQTARIAWDVMQLGPFPNEQNVRVGGYLDDTMASKGSCSHSLKCGGSVILRAYCVMRRVGIPGGFAVIVQSISEWFAYPAASAPWTYVTHDSGLAVVRPHEMQDVSAKLCKTQTIARLRTASADEVAAIRHPNQSRSQLTSDVGDVVIPSFREIMSSRHQDLDNALLDASRSKPLAT